VSAQAKILVNEVAVTEEELPERILQATKSKPDVEVHLRADQGVQYGIVVRIIAALTRAGVTKLGMMTAPVEHAPAQ